ncbi:helix-turn-helix domain-containing protein [Hymenobacter baengnokdamensis]|uniref:helix-turn-helix domain-containing protein n=1 Tax=Hymenobacter baengnokdamensis TaxID=2615203 RepID=UPI001243A26E|nr:helix-turn-helix domain-containing protein [Hymenobacter baengnokdamensis]
MQAYSIDLRERVVAAYATGEVTIGQVASRFAVSISFVDKLLKRQRTRGSVAALPHRGGPAPRLQEADRQRLVACVAAQPDATLAELRQQLVAAGSPAVGQTVRWQTLQQLDLRRKKRVCTPPSATPSG